MVFSSTAGAIIGLVIAIFLILKKVTPFYAMLLGAILGSLIGGFNLTDTINHMSTGASTMVSAILRIAAAGILAGVLIKSGAATRISLTILDTLGNKWALVALILTSFLITSIGVFIYVSVITIAPIALVTAKKLNYSKLGVLIALIGGGKCGNIVSTNPNAIAASDAFGIELTDLIMAGFLPACLGLIATFLIARILIFKGERVNETDLPSIPENLPSFASAIIGPAIVIFLIALRPLAGIKIDPLLALPLGGIIGGLSMGFKNQLNDFMAFGLEKMLPIAILLLGTGAIAGIITESDFKDSLISFLNTYHMPGFLLAPISGIIMGAATASTTSGTAVASSVFGNTILNLGVSKLAAASMIHAGATVIDHLPHGSFFHATSGSVFMTVQQRLKVIPYETVIGLVLTIASTILFGIVS
ncbi:MAG: GntP family permease [Leadbetterella sp.]